MIDPVSLQVPGDKSVTHRALILGALAVGTSRVRGALVSADTRATAAALAACGVSMTAPSAEEWRIEGRGLAGLRPPDDPLDLENSGTGARLLLGTLAGVPGTTVLSGDASLRSRPMRRVTKPLSLMGARFEELGEADRLPVRVHGAHPLRPLDHTTPVASAQVKSALLLAGLVGGAWVLVTEPRRSRDHTERMLRACGVPLIEHPGSPGWRVELREPPGRLQPLDLVVPGDISSAAFMIVARLLGGDAPSLRLLGVGTNPTRTGVLSVLERMGARITLEPRDEGTPEPVADLVVHGSALTATDLHPQEIPALVDEIPILAVAAARARGTTRIRGAGELRIKESDRLHALAVNLRSIGVPVEELPDGLDIEGTAAPLAGRVSAFHDHRIAMAFGVLSHAPGGSGIRIDTPSVVDVSFPGFWAALDRVPRAPRSGTVSTTEEIVTEPARVRAGTLVTVDGPAGSGKSTTARLAARALGLPHLDSGAIYRALTLAALEAGYDDASWGHVTRSQVEGLAVGVELGDGAFRVTIGGRPVPDEALRAPDITAKVSSLARVPNVRRALLGLQRSAARETGLVADGRDMGTVVFPDAHAKFFLVADLERRARRRLLERGRADPTPDELRQEADALQARDRIDSERDVSPLREPPDAIRIDTTDLTPEKQAALVVDHVRRLTG